MKPVKYSSISTQNVRQPDAAYARLYRMGLVDLYGNPELLGLEMLASVTSGCLYDDLGCEPALMLYVNALNDLVANRPKLVYAELTKAYYNVGEPVPKPLQLLFDDENCLLYFLFAFFENWRKYLSEDGLMEV